MCNRYIFLAFSLCVAALVSIVTYTLITYPWKSKPAPVVALPSTIITPTSATKYPPVSVRIPKLGKSWPVQAALVKGNTWDMFTSSVAWLSTSAVPGEGNVILYAHNWKSLWADLYKLKEGDEIDIQQNDKWISYKVTESKPVSAKDIDSILGNENRLTLYTCEGSFDEKRRIVVAAPK